MKTQTAIELLLNEAANRRSNGCKPFVTVSYAQSLDGSIAACRGRPLSLSSHDSLVLTHQLRAAHDAILVGIGTILADRPRLDVRLVDGKNPQPVVLDAHLHFPIGKGIREPSVWIAAGQHADPERQRILEECGAHVLRVPSNGDGMLELDSLLKLLNTLGITTLMVEGGARVITSFMRERLVDLLVVTISPVLVGGLHPIESPLRTSGNGFAGLSGFPRMEQLQCEKLGDDLVVWGRLR